MKKIIQYEIIVNYDEFDFTRKNYSPTLYITHSNISNFYKYFNTAIFL